MDINSIESAMEFLDLSDANDDEKAEAMAIIGSAPVYGVEFPFEFKASTDLSEIRDCVNSLPQTVTEQEVNQSLVDSRSFNETQTLRHKSSPTHEYIGSHSSEPIPQTSSSLTQWEMAAPTVGPVVCGPPPYLYHQTSPHYYPTNGPMPGPFYSPVANGTQIGMSSNKEVKMRSGSHNSNKSGKGIHSPDIRAPFYPPHNQYSEVPQLIDSSRAPPQTIVSDGMMALTNGPPVQPMFAPGFAPTFLPHAPFPAHPQMYIIATPEGNYLTYGLPTPPGVQMQRPSTPPVPNIVTEDMSVINTNVPLNDGNGSDTAIDEVNTELTEEINIDSNDENVDNNSDNQRYNELIIDSNADGFKYSDNESNPVMNNSSEINFNDSNDIQNEIQTNNTSIVSMPSIQENSVLTNQSSSVSAMDTTGAAYLNSSGGQKSWADLFKGSSGATIHNSLITSSNHSSSPLTSGPIVSQNFNNSLSESDSPLNSSVVLNCESERCAQIQCIPMCNDPFARKLAKRVKEIHLKHFLPFLIPYGLVNRGNWCYINATLQALVGCPPFYNLMREIGETSGLFRERSSTPIIDSFAKFFTHFNPSDHRKQRSGANVSSEDIPKGEPIEPRCIYEVLGAIKSECLKGRQEDAEEFLSSVLNGLHEEMIALFKILTNETEKKLNGDHLTANGHIGREHNGNNLQNIEDNDSNYSVVLII